MYNGLFSYFFQVLPPTQPWKQLNTHKNSIDNQAINRIHPLLWPLQLRHHRFTCKTHEPAKTIISSINKLLLRGDLSLQREELDQWQPLQDHAKADLHPLDPPPTVFQPKQVLIFPVKRLTIHWIILQIKDYKKNLRVHLNKRHRHPHPSLLIPQ